MLFSPRRLTIIIVILIMASGLFFLYNLDNQFLGSDDINPWAESSVVSAASSDWPDAKADARFVVVGQPQDKAEKTVQTHTLDVLDRLHLQYRNREVLKSNDYQLGETLIFVVSDLEKTGRLEDIAAFVKSGGTIILAAGMSTDYTKTFLDPVLGIVERGTFTTSTTIKILEGTLPYPETTIEDLTPFMVNNLRVADTTEVFIENGQELPLIWTNHYEKGMATVINGPFMTNPLTQGFLIAALANTVEPLIYPVVGAEVVSLDAAPPIFDSNDDLSFKYYGRSAESFVRDQLWNIFEQKASLLGLKYTTSFLGIDANPFNANLVNLQTFAFVNKQVLKVGGEISLAGDHNRIENLAEDRVLQVERFLAGMLPNYKIRAYYPLYGTCQPGHFQAIRKVFPSIDIFRYPLDYYSDTRSLAEFAVDDTTILFPTVTRGFKVNRDQFLTYLSQLTMNGLVSHSFDVNYLFTVPESESNWNELDDFYDELCDQYFGQTGWLDDLTISPAADRLKASEGLSFKTHTAGRTMSVYCRNFTDGQAFLIFSHSPVKIVKGAEVKPVNKNYYFITAHEPSFVLEFETDKGDRA